MVVIIGIKKRVGILQLIISIRGKGSTNLKYQWNKLYEDEIPEAPPEINDDNNATDGL
ncbi:hypothetical protein PSTG_12122 [Puccinia striiformis f. sp. tritici PST-78]|uniref:Uncharacterized protein n=1 Tax=Puccinia striiformis f. sp. tritici PST-78 TaxID=1165861 RepID=A0A0L0V5J6_9BASI|nr:hypothetical protein PSTG_12122 [Puccinia striiformis f. sp. tritici PST-78]